MTIILTELKKCFQSLTLEFCESVFLTIFKDMHMTFENLGLPDLSILDNAFEDTENQYKRWSKVDRLTESNFKSRYEKGIKFDGDPFDTAHYNSYFGISIIRVKQDEDLRAIIAPVYYKYVIIIKFVENAGKIIASPTLNNPEHHDFYKQDNFTMDLVKEYQISCNIERRERV